MKNYRVLDIFQTLQMLPKFKSSFLPNLPSSILRRQHHHSSHGASLRPVPSSPPPPGRRRAGPAFPLPCLCSALIVATSVQVLTLSCPRLLQLGSKLVLEYLPYFCQNQFSRKQTWARCSLVWPASLCFSLLKDGSFTWYVPGTLVFFAILILILTRLPALFPTLSPQWTPWDLPHILNCHTIIWIVHFPCRQNI